MNFRNTFAVAVFALAATALPAAAADPGFKVVVNASNTTTSVSREQLSRCFMKQTNTWINGEAVVPVDQIPDSPVRIEFSTTIHERDVNAVKSFWQRQIFSGSGVPPQEKASDEEVLAFVRANPGAIGYVSSSTPIGNGVKVLEVTSK
jgi:ABC-type phosphate transport system substrate-binding protein